MLCVDWCSFSMIVPLLKHQNRKLRLQTLTRKFSSSKKEDPTNFFSVMVTPRQSEALVESRIVLGTHISSKVDIVIRQVINKLAMDPS